MNRALLVFGIAAALTIGIFAAGCSSSGTLDDSPDKPADGLGTQRFIGQLTSYVTGPLPNGWRRLWGYDGDLAYFNPGLRATIMVNSTCPSKPNIPLTALRNHLLLDLTERQIATQEELELDLRTALRTVVQGRLDGALVKLDIYVVQIDQCVYDMVMISGLERYEAGRVDFVKFVEGFHVKRKG
jgi:hypothetical protein